MRRLPPKILEWVATLLIPPACREEVLGDLHERCASALGYCKDALIAIPCVIASRIRRIVDPPVLLLQAVVVYHSLLVSAWIAGGWGRFLDEWELWRLTIPTGAILIGMVLAEVYAKPGVSSRWQPVRGPLLGAGLAFVSRIAVPFQIVLYGAALSVILASITNLLCPPVTLRPPRRECHGALVQTWDCGGKRNQMVLRNIRGDRAIRIKRVGLASCRGCHRGCGSSRRLSRTEANLGSPGPPFPISQIP